MKIHSSSLEDEYAKEVIHFRCSGENEEFPSDVPSSMRCLNLVLEKHQPTFPNTEVTIRVPFCIFPNNNKF